MRASRFTLTQTYQGDWILGCVLRKDSVRDAMNLCDAQTGDYEVTVKRYRPIRSLSANAYFHVLCNKLANELNADMPEIKRALVLRYGEVEPNTEIRLPADVDPTEFYPYCQAIGRDEDTVSYVLFKETHRMNTTAFARLLNGTIEECHTLGIETLPDDEIQRLYAQAN